jgi:hypothetical protein
VIFVREFVSWIGSEKSIRCQKLAAAHEDATISGMTLADRIARIRIELNDIDSTIWRTVEVPLATSLKGLHDVIQAVMPFENYPVRVLSRL